jgi:hypothetical protein
MELISCILGRPQYASSVLSSALYHINICLSVCPHGDIWDETAALTETVLTSAENLVSWLTRRSTRTPKSYAAFAHKIGDKEIPYRRKTFWTIAHTQIEIGSPALKTLTWSINPAWMNVSHVLARLKFHWFQLWATTVRFLAGFTITASRSVNWHGDFPAEPAKICPLAPSKISHRVEQRRRLHVTSC